MIVLRCKHCAEPIAHDDGLRRYVHIDRDEGFDGDEVWCEPPNIKSPPAVPDLDRLVADATAALDERYTLLYLDRSDDGLTPKQIQVLLDGGNEWESSEFSFIEEREADLYRDAALQVLRDLLDPELYDLVDSADRLDELRWEVEGRDDSGGLVSLLLNASPNSLFRFDLGVDVPDYTVTSTEDDDTRRTIALATGLNLADSATAELVDELLANASYGGRLYALWYGDPADAVELAAPHEPDSERGTVTFTAHLLILDSWNGSGHEVEVPVITAEWGPRRVSIDAPRADTGWGRGYSWTDTAGPVTSAYRGTYTLVRPVVVPSTVRAALFPQWADVAEPYAGGPIPEQWVVTLVVGYDPATTAGTVQSPLQAARAALELTRDEGSTDTVWHVFDRATGEVHRFEQEDFEQQDFDRSNADRGNEDWGGFDVQ